MTLLRDEDLVTLINAPVSGAQPLVVGLPMPRLRPVPAGGGAAPDPWFGPESSIQPSSVDLHVGNIFLPGAKESESGTVACPKSEYVLTIGNTVVVTTREQLHLPNDIAAVGFPHGRLSFRGLLMTNIGHVDPGFNGPMRFAVMNIGKEPIPLKTGDPIVTLLFYLLSAPANEGWSQRHGNALASGPAQNQIDQLSMDFLDVDKRTASAASKAIKDAQTTAQWIGVWAPLIGFLVAIFLALIGAISVKSEVDTIKKALDLKEPRSEEIQKLQKRIEELELKTKTPLKKEPEDKKSKGQEDGK